MKKLATAGLVILLIGVAQVAMATSLLDGTIDTSSSTYHGPWNPATYDYAYLISTATLTPVDGSDAVTLSGHVSSLAFTNYNNWLEIGLVDKNLADAAIASGDPSSIMNTLIAYAPKISYNLLK